MDPARCTVVLVDGDLPPDNDLSSLTMRMSGMGVGVHADINPDSPVKLCSDLQQAFSQVIPISSPKNALLRLRKRPRMVNRPTIILINLDTTSTPHVTHPPQNKPIINSQNNCDTSMGNGELPGLELLKQVVRDREHGKMHNVVPVVYSCNDSTKFMTRCMNMGAADYLLRPIRKEVIKTLYLNLHRYHPFRNKLYISDRALGYSDEGAQENQLGQTYHHKDRLHEIFVRDAGLRELLSSYYSPHRFSVPVDNFPSMDPTTSAERLEYLASRLSSWDFIPHDLAEDDLLRCVFLIFQQVMRLNGLEMIRNTDDEHLQQFILAIRNSYHETNPFHNFAHAVDVLQAMYYFLCKLRLLQPMDPNQADMFVCPKAATESKAKYGVALQDVLRPRDILALIVSSIGHDVFHPGVNNMFLVNGCTPLAELYNDRSVLESFHAMSLFQLMNQYGFDCFRESKIGNGDYFEFRRLVINTILATDMGIHADYVRKIQDQFGRLQANGHALLEPSISETERFILCGALIKCADISNVSRPFPISSRWTEALVEEFANQGDLEKSMGMPVLPMNDRGKLSMAEGQTMFISSLSLPLFTAVANVLPEMAYTLDFIHENKRTWDSRMAH